MLDRLSQAERIGILEGTVTRLSHGMVVQQEIITELRKERLALKRKIRELRKGRR